MADDTPTEDAANRPYLRLRAVAAGVAGLGFLAVSLLGVGLDAEDGDQSVQVTQSVASGTDDRTAAIERWLAETDAVPATPYTGGCADTGTVGMLCSSPQEELGDVEIHAVGLHASDAGVDVLLERAGSGWTVAAAAPWPELGAPYAGPPWSPMTAITVWWSERAADAYGSPDAVHVPSCEEAEGGSVAGQTLLCSILVEDLGDTRVYDSGRAGAPADVRITVVLQPDDTWAVTETLAR